MTSAEAVVPAPQAVGPFGRLSAWIGARPLAGAGLVAALLVLQVAWAHGILWAAGRLETWAFDTQSLVLAIYAPWIIGALAIGIRVARSALATFWPATGWPDGERAEWAFRLTSPSPRLEWTAFVIGTAGGAMALAAAPEAGLGAAEGRLAVYVAYAPAFLLGYGSTAVGFVTTLHWLRLVVRIHREATAIDLFERAPIHAFSRLTVVVGLMYVLGAYYSFTINGTFQAGNLPSLTFIAANIVAGIAAFVAPLWGIHDRLVSQKAALLLDVERRTTRLAAELYARVDAGDFTAVPALNDTLTGLTALRERVDRLPTWPWPPQLLRGFISALLLPIVLFVISSLISTVLP